MPLMVLHLSYLVCVAFTIVSHASATPSKPSAVLLHTVADFAPYMPDNVYIHQPSVDDIFVLSRRDLSPDVLASSVPVSAKGSVAKFHPEDRSLRLRSSTHNVSGINGYRIYALPIFANDFSSLLSDTQTHLQNLDSDATTKFFQFNNTKWTFAVAAPNTTLHYSSIQAIVARFIRLSSSKIPSDITTTRVGLLLNGSDPIADVIITPCPAAISSTYIPFANFGDDHNLSSSEPTEITKVTAYGSSCFYETINETSALAPFLNLPATQSLTPRDLGGDILAQVGQTLFAISIRIFHQAVNGGPVQVELWMVVAVLLIAPLYILRLLLEYLCAGVIEGMGLGEKLLGNQLVGSAVLDSGFFKVGQMVGRLVMQITRKNAQGQLIWLRWETWREIIGRLVVPAELRAGEGRAAGARMNGLQAAGWAMEGEIYGPENGDEGVDTSGRAADGDGSGGGGGGGRGRGDRNNSQVVIGRWQLWVGDAEL